MLVKRSRKYIQKTYSDRSVRMACSLNGFVIDKQLREDFLVLCIQWGWYATIGSHFEATVIKLTEG